MESQGRNATLSIEPEISERAAIIEAKRRYPDTWLIYKSKMTPHELLSVRERMEVEGPNRILVRSEDGKESEEPTEEEFDDAEQGLLISHPKIKTGDLDLFEKYGDNGLAVWSNGRLISLAGPSNSNGMTLFPLFAFTDVPPYHYWSRGNYRPVYEEHNINIKGCDYIPTNFGLLKLNSIFSIEKLLLHVDETYMISPIIFIQFSY